VDAVRTALALTLLCIAGAADAADPAAEAAALAGQTARFAPVAIAVAIDGLPGPERQALAKIVAAARVMDGLFLAQVAPGNVARLLALAADTSPLGAARLAYFVVNKGSWSRLDHDAPFLAGAGAKPGQGSFYPEDATRADVEAWFKTLSEQDREAATGFFTTIRRGPSGALVAVPYSVEYQSELMTAARYLREAAALTTQPSLRTYLQARAQAFLSNDYFASDVAWMDLDASIEPTIGPYEVYEDQWFNYKAAFEAIIAVVDPAESAKLARFSRELQFLEDHLPIDPRYRRGRLGGYSPIRVVNVVYAAGDGNRGVQLAAFNLPNDERVVTAKGSKRVLLKNFQEAKFRQVLAPIAARALAPRDRPLVAFEPFFTHILMHELMHGLGPQTITVNGRATTVRQELKELNGPLEEAKADIAGLWALQQLIDSGVLPKADERALYVTFLASAFRTLRFGASEAHARGMALQLNYLLDAGAVRLGPDGRFAVDFGTVKAAVAGLTHEIMTLQATGDYPAARDWLGRMQVIRPEVQRLLQRLDGIPVDIRPQFVTAERLAAD
jgi:hypothetical protein